MKMSQIKSRMALALILVVVQGTNALKSEPLPDEVLAMIEEWAPVIWLHPEEEYFPSSVDFFFEHTEVRDKNETVRQTSPDRYTVLTGPETSDMHLNSVPDLECPQCKLDWFAGQNVGEVPVPTYVFVKDYKDSCGTFDVAYRGFYPYNYGKDVCIGTIDNDICHGVKQSFGNHVGDWEHYSIRIRYGKVESCYVSVHSFGAWYNWNDTTGNFQFDKGEEDNFSIINVTYPATVEVVDGYHAELFSGNGSHGLWSSDGSHEYVNFLFVHLSDQTERGYAWQTWDWLDIVNYDADEKHDDDLHYMDYRGRWGNLERGCEIVEPVAGECILASGPGFWRQGPGDFPDDCQPL